MRYSVDSSDPGYANYRAAQPGRLVVYLDDQKLDRCITADEDTGEVVVIKCDAAGVPLIDRVAGMVIRETRSGRVRVAIEHQVKQPAWTPDQPKTGRVHPPMN